MQGTDEYISDKVFPVIPVDKASDSYYVYTKNDWFRDEAQVRPPATESVGGGGGIGTDNYNTKTWAFPKTYRGIFAPIRTMASTWIATPPSLSRSACSCGASATGPASTLARASGVPTITGVASAPSTNQVIQWSNMPAATRPAIRCCQALYQAHHGHEPERPGPGATTCSPKLKRHTAIKDQYNTLTLTRLPPPSFAKLFDIDRVLVAGGVYATNNARRDRGPTALCRNGRAAGVCRPIHRHCCQARATPSSEGHQPGRRSDRGHSEVPDRELKVDRGR